MSNKYLIWAVALLCSTSCLGQAFSPRLILKNDYVGNTELKDSVGEYQKSAIKIGFVLPVFAKLRQNTKVDKPSFMAVLVHGMYGQTQMQMNPYFEKRTFHDISLGSSLIRTSRGENVLIASLRFNIFEDAFTIKENISILPTALVLYRITKTNNTSYTFGGTYNYTLGYGLPIPLLGLSHNFSAKTKLNLMLPLSANFSYRPTNEWFFQANLKPAGGLSYFNTDKSNFLNSESRVLLRNRALRLGLKSAYSIKSLSFILESGLLFKNSVTISDTKSDLFQAKNPYFESSIKPQSYFSLGIQFSLRGSDAKKTDPSGLDWLGFD